MMKSPQPIRVGLIGLDTSHVTAFTKVLNDRSNPEHIPGATVVAGWPGGSPDFEMSIGRVERFTRELREQHGVQILKSPEAVAEAVDLACITAVDGRVHRELFDRIACFGRPTFIDKPFATTLADAHAIFRRADEEGVAAMSCSSLRYADHLVTALNQLAAAGEKIVGCDIFGAFSEEPTQGGWFWYGIHLVEIMQRTMGTGCREVNAIRAGEMELLTATYDDGRTATIRGLRGGHKRYGVALHGERSVHQLDLSAFKRSWYASMLEAILRTLPNQTSDIAPCDTLEIIRILEAANQSRGSAGRRVTLSSLRDQ
jgi:predicted dehydrogenase